MLTVLEFIWHALQSLPYWIINLFIMSINGLIIGISLIIQSVVAALPPFPAPPGAPDNGILSFLNWIVPLGPLLGTFMLFVSCWMAFLAIRVTLKIFKVL